MNLRRTVAGLTLAGAALGGAVACSPAPHRPQAAPAVTSSRSTTPATAPTTAAQSVESPLPSGAAPCYVAPPASWRAEWARATTWTRQRDVHQVGAPLPDGHGALYYRDAGTDTEVGIVDTGHRIVERIGTVPNPYRQGQITYSRIDARYGEFVFAPRNGQTASYEWQLYLWDRSKHTLRRIAANPTDGHGHALPGGWVEPSLTEQDVTWIQATPRTGAGTGSELVRYDLATGATTVLYRGLVTAFVRYGDTALFSAADGAGNPDAAITMRMAGVDVRTGRAVPPPAGLDFAAEPANTLRTDGTTVVWSTDQVVRAWSPARRRTVTVLPSAVAGWPAGAKLQLGPPTYPRLYRDFLVWNSNGTYVLDLRTNSFTRLESAASGIDMSGPYLAVEEESAGAQFDRSTNTGTYDLHLLDLDRLDGLPGCG